MIKKYKTFSAYVNDVFQENYDDVLDHIVRLHKDFSLSVAVIYFVYTLGVMLADYYIFQVWTWEMLPGFLISGLCAANWRIVHKHLLPRGKATIIGANCFLFLLLQALAWTRALSDGYISNTLITCTILTTSVISMHPPRYIKLIIITELSECVLGALLWEYPLSTLVYRWLDYLIILFSALVLNMLLSSLQYKLFEEKSQLKKESAIDPMTGLYTRKYFERYFQLHHREDELAAMMHIDLDNFKTLNDTLGHQQGDAMLMKIADILRDSFRKTDCVSRVGGDEFMVFMASLSETGPAFEKVQKILNCFPIAVQENGQEVSISVSIGVVFSDRASLPSYQELYQMADSAMYQAKKTGKGHAVVLGIDGAEDILLFSKNKQ